MELTTRIGPFPSTWPPVQLGNVQLDRDRPNLKPFAVSNGLKHAFRAQFVEEI